MSVPKFTSLTLTPARVLAGRPVALGDSRHLGVLTGGFLPSETYEPLYGRAQVRWASGGTNWIELRGLVDYDLYLERMEQEVAGLQEKRVQLGAVIATTLPR